MNIIMTQKELDKIIADHIHSKLHDASAKLKITYERDTLGIKVHVNVAESKPKQTEENYA